MHDTGAVDSIVVEQYGYGLSFGFDFGVGIGFGIGFGFDTENLGMDHSNLFDLVEQILGDDPGISVEIVQTQLGHAQFDYGNQSAVRHSLRRNDYSKYCYFGRHD